MDENQIYKHFQIIDTACIIIVFLYVASGITACKPKETDLPFETVEKNKLGPGTGHDYSTLRPGLVLITQPEEVTILNGWIGNDSKTKLQKLDYNKVFALLVLQGEQGSGGFGVQINRIAQQGDTVNVYAQFFMPNQGEPEFSVVTSPYHLVKIKKDSTWGQEITFQVIVKGKVVVSPRHFIP